MHPIKVFSALLRTRRHLLWEMTKRDLASRYRGSHLGMFWAILLPLAMLVIYSYVFGAVFKSRWENSNNADVPFPLVLFAGLIVFNFFAECLNRAPTLVSSSPNFVKKAIFPLEILPWMAVLTAAINSAISVAILLASEWFWIGHIPLTAVLFPLVLVPVAFVALGAGWFLASLGVYVRDIAQLVGLVTTALLFFTPIFYPPTNIPVALRSLATLNPMAVEVQAMRDVLLWGRMPDPATFLLALLAGWVTAWLGLIWFSSTSDGFADVL
ncbi:ABC transporter permease [Burkholderia plantarii]|uniref:ABC transporter permease n=1 Tax=Burkholderia plantarii TaxID=41899 RepID=UPI0018DC0990|nr:ABC transporter permease [Burkholderia plantarii]MBI0326198.1 ABC transporter permease [Burkholderia plantarii]